MNIILIEVARLIAMVAGFGFSIFFFYMNIKGKFHDYPKWTTEEIAGSVIRDTILSFLPFIIVLFLTK